MKKEYILLAVALICLLCSFIIMVNGQYKRINYIGSQLEEQCVIDEKDIPKIGDRYIQESDNPFIEPILCTVNDVKDGYVQYLPDRIKEFNDMLKIDYYYQSLSLDIFQRIMKKVEDGGDEYNIKS